MPAKPSALEIGAGTGVISIMLAQACPAMAIIALEPNPTALAICRKNFANSPFSNQLLAKPLPLQAYTSAAKFDLIFSNPPFYKNSLKSDNTARNQAMHQDSLSFQELAYGVSRILKPKGQFWVILPAYELNQLERELLSCRLHINSQLSIFAHPDKPVIRKIAAFSFEPSNLLKQESICIKDSANAFTPDYIERLKPYYTIF